MPKRFVVGKFRKHKGAIKLHTQFDIKSDIPHFVHFSDGSVHDVNVMDILVYEPGSFYVFDQGYVDFSRLYNIHQKLAWFVTSAKENMNYRRLYLNKVDKSTGIKVDQVIKLNNYYAAKDYPDKLRLIKFYDSESVMDLEFLSTNFELKAIEIAMLYKYRRRIELFFKWIKQHLQIQSFWGENRKMQSGYKFIPL